jgi:hypothetical protein
MDESASWMLNTLELCLPNTPEKHVSLASTTPALTVNSNIFIQSVYAWNEETELSASSNTLNSSYLSHMNHESTGTSHDEHQPSGSDNAKLEPPRRKGHTKSRRGCYNCKKRRVKVHLTHQFTRRKTKMYHSVQRIIQRALNVLDVASNVNGQSFTLTKEKL